MDNAKSYFYKSIQGSGEQTTVPIIKRSSSSEINIQDDFQDWAVEFNTDLGSKQTVSKELIDFYVKEYITTMNVLSEPNMLQPKSFNWTAFCELTQVLSASAAPFSQIRIDSQ